MEAPLPRTIDIAPGFRLRAWRMGDLDALVRHANDEQVSRGVSDLFPFPYSEADGIAFLTGKVVDPGSGPGQALRMPVFAIEIDGESCGGIGTRHLNQGERRHMAEFGYWLGRACWGQGWMTRAVAAYAPWAMRALSLYRLQATVLDFNVASARALEKNGFVEEGTLRRAVVKGAALHDLRLFARTREVLDDAA